MAEKTRRIRKIQVAKVADFDEQLWPINVAILILAGFIAGLIIANGRFSEPRLLLNAGFLLFTLALTAGLSFWALWRLQGKVRRRVLLCTVVSLLIHVWIVMFAAREYIELLADKQKEEKEKEELELREPEPEYHPHQMERPQVIPTFAQPLEAVAPRPAEPEAVQRAARPLEIPAQVGSPDEPVIPQPQQANPAVARRAEPSAPRRAERAAGTRISRRDRKHRLRPDEPIPEPEIKTQPQRTAGLPKTDVAALKKQETQVPVDQRRTFEEVSSRRERPVEIALARRAPDREPLADRPTTPTPTRQVLRPDNLPRTPAPAPEPPKVAQQAPKPEQPPSTFRITARQQADAPKLVAQTPDPTPMPTAPQARVPAVARQRRPEQPLQLAQAPRPISMRRPREVTPPIEMAQPEAEVAAPRVPRSGSQLELAKVQVPRWPDASTIRSPVNVSQPSTNLPVRPAPGAIVQDPTARVQGRTQPSPQPRVSQPGQITRSQAAPRIKTARIEQPAVTAPEAPAGEPGLPALEPTATALKTAADGPPRFAQNQPPGRELPAMTYTAQVPSAFAPRRSTVSRQQLAGADAAPAWPTSLAGLNRGIRIPSTVIPTEAQVAPIPAGEGTTPSSRIEQVAFNAAARRSGAEPPSGEWTAAAGTVDFAAGSAQIVARTGQPRGSGFGEPSATANAPISRVARVTGPAASTAAWGAADAGPAAPGTIASTTSGVVAPSLSIQGSAARRGGTIRQLAERITIGLGPAGSGGTPGPIGAAQISRITRPESIASEVASSGTPNPGRTDSGAFLAEAAAEGSEVATAATPGGTGTQGPALQAPASGARRQVPGLPGGFQSQPMVGAPASLSDEGAPLARAAARRTTALQRQQPGGPDISAAESVTMKRSPAGTDLPTPAVPLDDVPKPGAGGLSVADGGPPSSLQKGPSATVRRAAADVPLGPATLASGIAESGLGSSHLVALAGPVRETGEDVPAPTAAAATSELGRSAIVGPAIATSGPPKTEPAAELVAGGPPGQAEGLPQPGAGAPLGAVAQGTNPELSATQPAQETGLLAGPGGAAVAVARLSPAGRDDTLMAAASAGAAAVPLRRTGAMQTSGTSTAAPELAPAGPSTGGLDAAPDVSLQAGLMGPRRQVTGLPGGLMDRTTVETAVQLGPIATTAGRAKGLRRVPQGQEPGPSLAAEVGRGPLRKTDSPGLPGGVSEAVEEQPVATAASAEPGEVIGVAEGTGLGQPRRQTGGLPVQIAAVPGPGGLGYDPSPNVGLPSRRARPESEIIHTISRRLVIERTGGKLTIDGRVRERPAEAFRQRDRGRRAQIARARGGSGGTEMAVEIGLDYFVRTQFPDGHWSLHELPPHASGWSADRSDSAGELVAGVREVLAAMPEKEVPKQTRQRLTEAVEKHRSGSELSQSELDELRRFTAGFGQMKSDSAATGLALLTYLGAGYTHLDDKHRAVVNRGVDWLVRNQEKNGDLFSKTGGTTYTRFYSHGLAAIALCEAYGMTRDPDLREPARKAIDFIIKTQHPTKGGWRYDLDQNGTSTESDTSVSGWMLMALKSAQMAGLEVPDQVLQKVDDWLNTVQAKGADGQYIYNPYADRNKPEQRAGLKPNLAMTAEAMLMRMYLGHQNDDPGLIAGAEHLKKNLPQLGSRPRSVRGSLRDCYYWYYATQAMIQMQGDYWTGWNDRLRELAVSSQVQFGEWAGSWHPRRPVPDKWSDAGGRLYVTALHLLMLEVYYRHLPLFQELSK